MLVLLWTSLAHGASDVARANGRLADYRFDGNGADALGRSAAFVLKNVPFEQGALFLNGGYEHGGSPGGFKAIGTISNLSYETFTVSLDFWPVDFKSDSRTSRRLETFLNRVSFGYFSRRSVNSHDPIIVGGPSYRWFSLRQMNKGNLELTLNNQKFVHTFPGISVSTRRWHNLICSVDVKRRLILTVLDGQPLESVTLPDTFQLDVIGSPSDPTDKEFTFTSYSYGAAFHGFADNLQVFGHALSSAEMGALHAGTKAERPVFQPQVSAAAEVEGNLFWLLPLLLIGGVTFWFLRRCRRTVVPDA